MMIHISEMSNHDTIVFNQEKEIKLWENSFVGFEQMRNKALFTHSEITRESKFLHKY